MGNVCSSGLLRPASFAVPFKFFQVFVHFCFAVFSLAVISSVGFAQTAIDEAFQPTTPVETLTAPFTTTGATTANEYTDLVEINMSGFGQGAGPQVNDAFYVFESAPGNPVTPQPIWTLDPSMGAGSSFFRLSLSGCACSFECGAPSISEFMAFIDGWWLLERESTESVPAPGRRSLAMTVSATFTP